MNIFIAKISPSTNDEDLKNLFSTYGEVVSAKVIIDKMTGLSKCYGFVEMPDDSQANQAIAALNETDFKDNKIVVKVSVPRDQNAPRKKFVKRSFNRSGE